MKELTLKYKLTNLKKILKIKISIKKLIRL